MDIIRCPLARRCLLKPLALKDILVASLVFVTSYDQTSNLVDLLQPLSFCFNDAIDFEVNTIVWCAKSLKCA